MKAILKKRIWIEIGISVIILLLLVAALIPNTNGRKISPLLISQSWLRMAYIHFDISSNDDDVPSSFAFAVMSGMLPDYIFTESDFLDEPQDVELSGVTLEMIRRNPELIHDLEGAAEVFKRSQAWEPVGRFLVSHEAAAYRSLNQHVIVGLSRSEKGGIVVQFLMADGSVEMISGRSQIRNGIMEHVARDREARRLLELDDPPDFLGEIASFRSSRGLRPIPE